MAHIQPSKQTQNGGIESFNGKLRDECLDPSWFFPYCPLLNARSPSREWFAAEPSRTRHGDTERKTNTWRVESCFAFLKDPYGEDQPSQDGPNGPRFVPAVTPLLLHQKQKQVGEAEKHICFLILPADWENVGNTQWSVQ
jgi:putative transposase